MKRKLFIHFTLAALAFLSCGAALGVKGYTASAAALDKQNATFLQATGAGEEVMPSSYCMRDEYIVYA